jgi:hypothetical protein
MAEDRIPTIVAKEQVPVRRCSSAGLSVRRCSIRDRPVEHFSSGVACGKGQIQALALGRTTSGFLRTSGCPRQISSPGTSAGKGPAPIGRNKKPDDEPNSDLWNGELCLRWPVFLPAYCLFAFPMGISLRSSSGTASFAQNRYFPMARSAVIELGLSSFAGRVQGDVRESSASPRLRPSATARLE